MKKYRCLCWLPLVSIGQLDTLKHAIRMLFPNKEKTKFQSLFRRSFILKIPISNSRPNVIYPDSSSMWRESINWGPLWTTCSNNRKFSISFSTLLPCGLTSNWIVLKLSFENLSLNYLSSLKWGIVECNLVRDEPWVCLFKGLLLVNGNNYFTII